MSERYSRNPFRLLDLAVGADADAVDRAAARMAAALSIGRNPEHLWETDLFPAAKMDRDAIEGAARSLRDPPARFGHELFWIWGTWGRAEEALASVAGQYGALRLVELFETWSGENRAADLHDAAVLLHAAALREADRAMAGEPLTVRPGLPCPLAASADLAWRAFLAEPRTHQVLLDRARALDDPRLDERAIHELQAGALEEVHGDLGEVLVSAYRRQGIAALDRIDAWIGRLSESPELCARAGAALGSVIDPEIERVLARTIPAVNELGAGGGDNNLFARTHRWVEVFNDFLVHGLRPFQTRRVLAEKSGLGGAPWFDAVAEVVRVLHEILALLGQGGSQPGFRRAVRQVAGNVFPSS